MRIIRAVAAEGAIVLILSAGTSVIRIVGIDVRLAGVAGDGDDDMWVDGNGRSSQIDPAAAIQGGVSDKDQLAIAAFRVKSNQSIGANVAVADAERAVCAESVGFDDIG